MGGTACRAIRGGRGMICIEATFADRATSARLAAVALILTVSGSGCGRPRIDPVNSVILVIVDTLRADHLGLYGYSRPTSPHLDAWASEGVVFERAFSTSSWTLPSVASIFTGHYPAAHRAGQRVKETGFRASRRVDTELPMLAEQLRDHGFRTAAFINNPWLKPNLGIDRGFDLFDKGRKKGRLAEGVVERAVNWLNENHQEKHFVVVHIMDPHVAYFAPEPARGRFTETVPGDNTFPVGRMRSIRRRIESLPEDRKEFIKAAYDEEILYVDIHLETFFRALEDLGLWGRSLVLLTSDHGEELFDHGGFEHGHSLYQELLHVPLIVWGPGIAGARIGDAVSLVDIAPTVRDAVGLEREAISAGVSLWPTLTSRSRPPRERSLFAEGTLYGQGRVAVVRWPYKLEIEEATGQRRLFDLSADPREINDLAADEPELMERLSREVAVLRSTATATEDLGDTELDEQTRRELEALGYVQ